MKKIILYSIPLLVIILLILSFCFFLNGFTLRQDTLILGQYGDFIGGLFGTILASISLILLIFTFFAQRKMLIVELEKNDLEKFNELLKSIIEDINDLEYKEHKGIKALFNFNYDFGHDDQKKLENRNSVLNHLSLILTSFRTTIDYLNNNKYIKGKIKKANLDRIYLLYNSKITWPVYERIYNIMYDKYKDENGKEHMGLKDTTDASIIFPRYKELIRETYKYLVPRELIKEPLDNDKMMAIIKNQ